MADTIDHDPNKVIEAKSSSSSSVITVSIHPDSCLERMFKRRPDVLLWTEFIPIVGPEVVIDEQDLLSRSQVAYSKFQEMFSLVDISSSLRDRVVRGEMIKARAKILSSRNKFKKNLSVIETRLHLHLTSWVELPREELGMVPASDSAIEALQRGTLRDFVKQDICGDFSCSICLEDLQTESLVTRMPCSHVFHDNCITHWLNISHYCPMCRFQLP